MLVCKLVCAYYLLLPTPPPPPQVLKARCLRVHKVALLCLLQGLDLGLPEQAVGRLEIGRIFIYLYMYLCSSADCILFCICPGPIPHAFFTMATVYSHLTNLWSLEVKFFSRYTSHACTHVYSFYTIVPLLYTTAQIRQNTMCALHP